MRAGVEGAAIHYERLVVADRTPERRIVHADDFRFWHQTPSLNSFAVAAFRSAEIGGSRWL